MTDFSSCRKRWWGAVRLTENETVIAGEENVLVSNCDTCHHEQTELIQKSFQEDVRNLLFLLEETGNPFMDTNSKALETLDTS